MSGDAATYEVSNTDRNNEDSAYQGDSENENAINSSSRIDEPISISSVNSKTSFFDFDTIFNSESKYSVEVLAQKIKEQFDSNNENSLIDISYDNIDCGNDNKEEVLVTISYDFPTGYYEVYLVVSGNEDNHELDFIIDAGQTDEVSIDKSGRVEKSRNVEANVRNYEYGHIDSEGVYCFDYGKNYYLTSLNFEKLKETDESWGDIQIEEYYFTEDVSLQEYKYCIFKLDENFEKNYDESLYDQNGKYYKAFSDAGLCLVSSNEIEECINDAV
ncbi:hypothetical protein [Butyrivibrio sp. XB500-5]|uniref:hypothetical protein n=1 Tax=Butyrivibrio sp. XB500-5 TaxID=2364880 RepID=UPI0011C21D10|nr:hypothetical protein [Butyrivibrio sp. XB500-5]